MKIVDFSISRPVSVFIFSVAAVVFGILKWISIGFFLVITVFPLLYMIGLSFKPISELLRNPDGILPSWSDITSLDTRSGEVRLIEVKGLAAATATILWSPNDRRVAEERRDRSLEGDTCPAE